MKVFKNYKFRGIHETKVSFNAYQGNGNDNDLEYTDISFSLLCFDEIFYLHMFNVMCG